MNLSSNAESKSSLTFFYDIFFHQSIRALLYFGFHGYAVDTDLILTTVAVSAAINA